MMTDPVQKPSLAIVSAVLFGLDFGAVEPLEAVLEITALLA
ncbi:MAG: hypothetical protein ACFCVA_20130 [Gammaproteobacteria bacterium]